MYKFFNQLLMLPHYLYTSLVCRLLIAMNINAYEARLRLSMATLNYRLGNVYFTAASYARFVKKLRHIPDAVLVFEDALGLVDDRFYLSAAVNPTRCNYLPNLMKSTVDKLKQLARLDSKEALEAMATAAVDDGYLSWSEYSDKMQTDGEFKKKILMLESGDRLAISVCAERIRKRHGIGLVESS